MQQKGAGVCEENRGTSGPGGSRLAGRGRGPHHSGDTIMKVLWVEPGKGKEGAENVS